MPLAFLKCCVLLLRRIWYLGRHCRPSFLSSRHLLVPSQASAHLEDPPLLLLGHLVLQLVRRSAIAGIIMP